MKSAASLLPAQPVVIDKIPGYCDVTKDFQPGDILIFNIKFFNIFIIIMSIILRS